MESVTIFQIVAFTLATIAITALSWRSLANPRCLGWSSLVERAVYSTSAVCTEQTTVRKLHRRKLRKLLEIDPVNGLIFFQRLAGMLGERLLESYARYEKLYKGDTYV